LSETLWQQIDRMEAAHVAAVKTAKQVAGETHFVRLKVADTGVWSARRSLSFEGGAEELYATSGAELVEKMRAEVQHHKRCLSAAQQLERAAIEKRKAERAEKKAAKERAKAKRRATRAAKAKAA
jgi:hypothetical protein